MTRVHGLNMPRPISPVNCRILSPASASALPCTFRLCFQKYSFDITHLFQSLPSSLMSLKVSRSPQRNTRSPHPTHSYPTACLHRSPCNLLLAFLSSIREYSLTSALIQKSVKQTYSGGAEGIYRKKRGVFNKIAESSFSWRLLGGHPRKDEAEYLLPSQTNASFILSRQAYDHRSTC